MRIRFTLLLIGIFSLIYVGYTQITAQGGSTCPGTIENALQDVGNNCGGLDRNSACYGYDSVMATFTDTKPSGFFTLPSDRAGLTDLQGITTAPLDQALNQWGVALLSVQANLPDTLPGQSVVFMVVGGTQIENAVAPEDAFQTAGTASVTLQIGADLYFEADMISNVVGSIPAGTSLTADAVSEDGQWVRVAYQGTPGWVTRQVLNADADLTTLAVMGPNTRTPMQAFYFRTSITGTECADAPTSLIVQGPQNLMVDINANGADIRLGSTIALSALDVDPMTLRYLQEMYGDVGSVGKLLKIVVLDGHVVLNPGTDEEIELETGETTFRCLSDPENLGLDGEENDRTVIDTCPWAPEREVTVEELEEFRDIEGFPLNYVLELPLALPTLTPTATSTPRPAGVFIPSSTPVPTLEPTWTPLPTDAPYVPPPPTDVPPPTATPAPVCDGYVFPANIGAGDGAGLIEAINHANDEVCHPGTDTINLGGETYSYSTPNNTTDAANALPVITSGIVINGNGSTISVGGEATLRLFHNTASLSLIGITLQYGNAGGANGGNIFNAGALSISGSLLLYGAAENGGNVYNAGTMSVGVSEFSYGYAGTNGGNLYNAGTASFDRVSLINGNGDNGGGGIYNTGNVDMLNSTLGNNYSNGGGWAVQNEGAGTVLLNFVTVAQNGGDGGAGLAAIGGSITLHNSVVASNYAAPACATFGGSLTGNNTSFAEDNSCTAFSFIGGGFTLGSLEGFPPSYQIYPPSSSVDNTACTTNAGATVILDEVGFARPYAVTPDVISDCDAGAREWDGSPGPA